LAPIDIAYDGSLMAAASPVHVVTALRRFSSSRSRSWGNFITPEQRISFLEPDALLIIVLVFAAFGLIYYLG
jgi:cation:H+ antiporter